MNISKSLLDKFRALISARTAAGSLITLDEYQKEFDLSGNQIGRHFQFTEPRFLKDVIAFKGLEVNIPLMCVLDKFRDLSKEAVIINSFNRTKEYQAELKLKGLKAAEHSPHVVKMAADIKTKGMLKIDIEIKRIEEHFDADIAEEKIKELQLERMDLAKNGIALLEEVSDQLQIPIRLGAADYNYRFIHVDVCPLYYAKNRPYHTAPHPVQWEYEARW